MTSSEPTGLRLGAVDLPEIVGACYCLPLRVDNSGITVGREMKTGGPGRKHGQYLAFTRYYKMVNWRLPAESDIQRCFSVLASAAHPMLVALYKYKQIH